MTEANNMPEINDGMRSVLEEALGGPEMVDAALEARRDKTRQEIETMPAFVRDLIVARVGEENFEGAVQVMGVLGQKRRAKEDVRRGEVAINRIEIEKVDPRLRSLILQVKLLPEKKRMCQGKVRTPIEIVNAIPNVEAFLGELSTLKQPEFWGVSRDGQLLMGESCAYAAKRTFGEDGEGLSYSDARTFATRVCYVDEDGGLKVIEGDGFVKDEETEDLILDNNEGTIAASSVLSERGLCTWDEYMDRNYRGSPWRGRLDRVRKVRGGSDILVEFLYVEAGRDRGSMLEWDGSFDGVPTQGIHGENMNKKRHGRYGGFTCGSRWMLRTNLNFQD